MVLTAMAVLAGAAGPAYAQAIPSGAPPQREKFPSQQHIFDQLPPEIQDELLEETERAAHLCNRHGIFSVYQDCECIAVKFLDARIAMGPDMSTEGVLSDVGRECPNKPAIAGYVYRTCQASAPYAGRFTEKELDEFCHCVGNSVAEAYARTPINSIRYQTQLASNAYQRCGLGIHMRQQQIEYQRRKAAQDSMLP